MQRNVAVQVTCQTCASHLCREECVDSEYRSLRGSGRRCLQASAFESATRWNHTGRQRSFLHVQGHLEINVRPIMFCLLIWCRECEDEGANGRTHVSRRRGRLWILATDHRKAGLWPPIDGCASLPWKVAPLSTNCALWSLIV